MMRFGLVALAIVYMTSQLLARPITLDVSAWYSRYGFAALAIYAIIILYAFYHSLGGRPLLDTSRLDE